MVTLEEIRRKVRGIENINHPEITLLVDELEHQMDQGEVPVDVLTGKYCDCLAILVPTEKQIWLLYMNRTQKNSWQIIQYKDVTTINYESGAFFDDLIIEIIGKKIVINDVSRIEEQGAYQYILGRLLIQQNHPTAVLPVKSECYQRGIDFISFQAANNTSGRLAIFFAAMPFFNFVSFGILAWRARSTKYFFTMLFYLIATWWLLSSGSLGLYFLTWIIGIFHFLNARKSMVDSVSNGTDHKEVPLTIEENNAIEIPIGKVPLEGRTNFAPTSQNPYIEKMRQLNIAIEDEIVSNYLDEMEVICADIFVYVEKRPEKEVEMKNFINYYLPQTFSLLEQYDDLSGKTMKTANIQQAMNEITDVLAVIVEAFKNLYNKLYENEATQISTEIKVLKNILTQHGLTKDSSHFNFKK